MSSCRFTTVPAVAAIFLSFVALPAPCAVDSKTCGECHQAIYRTYSLTPMAKTSGLSSPATAPPAHRTEFDDPSTATRFRVSVRGKTTDLHFAQGEIEGNRQLDDFIGAGVVGRSYASMIAGYLFQAPVSFYTATGDWDISPGFEGFERLPLTRPVEPACLNCHASGLHTVDDTVNGYATPAFSESGISCERCHGPGEAHVAKMKSGDTRHGLSIVNPAKLDPAERDSVCGQCHLVGAIRVARWKAGKYEPGGRLFDSTSAFLWNARGEPLGANSHFEQLVRSACWKNSKGKLWCGSCHSPHAVVPETARAAVYRARCLSCHTVTAPACSAPAQRRKALNDDCIECHMPSKPISTVAHGVQVDHTISRVPSDRQEPPLTNDASLVPFPGSAAGDREIGLAYASEALPRNNRVWGERAFEMLKKVAAAHSEDGAVAVQLAQLYDRMRDEEQSCRWFQQAVTDGAPGTGALVNFGACEAKRGDVAAAMKHWALALQRNPALEPARLNLAVAQSQTGDLTAARQTLETGLQYDPFSPKIHELLRSLPAQ